MTPKPTKFEYFQAIPFYTKADPEVFAWFSAHLDDLDAMTGRSLPVIVPESVKAGEAADVYSAAEEAEEGDGKKRRRYPGLKRADFPCLWVEGKGGKHFTLPLPKKADQIPEMLRKLADAAEKSNNIDMLREKIANEKTLPRPIEDNYLKLVVILAALMVMMVILYVLSASFLHENATGIVAIAVLAVIGLLPAVVLFLLIDSYAEFRGQPLGMDVKLGGAAAVWGIVFVLGLLYQSSLPAPGTFTAKFYFDVGGNPGTPMPTGGEIEAQLSDPRAGRIQKGFGEIPSVPKAAEGKSVILMLRVPGYELTDPKAAVRLSEKEPPRVPVQRSAELGSLYAKTFNCGIYFYKEGTTNKVPANGSITLDFNTPMRATIDQGYASVANVPEALNDEAVNFSVELAGYRVVDQRPSLRLKPDGRLEVFVRPDPPEKPE